MKSKLIANRKRAGMPPRGTPAFDEVQTALQTLRLTDEAAGSGRTRLTPPSNMTKDNAMAILNKHGVPAPTGYAPKASDTKKGNAGGGAAFVTDRDEKGEAKAPERMEVPRVAKKKKEAQPEEVAPPAPVAAPPAPAPTPAPPAPVPTAGGGNVLEALPTELILKIVEELPKIEGFEQNKELQDALIQVTEILKGRPVEPAKPEAGAMPMAASKKAGEPFGGKQAPPFGKKDEKDEKKEASIRDLKIAEAEKLSSEAASREERIDDVPIVAGSKVAVTPPGISEDLMHKLKSEYPGEPDKAYATAWKIHNESSLKTAAQNFIAEVMKIANGGASGGWSWDQTKGDVEEGGSRVPEVDEAHGKIDEGPAKLNRPDTTLPIKLSAEMTAGKAVKQAEKLGQDLKAMYLQAKALTSANDSRPVREAVEAIFAAGNMFDEAVKVFAKQLSQEEQEEQAAKIKGKKSSFLGLAVAAAAE
jgi:hypothetical protein